MTQKRKEKKKKLGYPTEMEERKRGEEMLTNRGRGFVSPCFGEKFANRDFYLIT